MASPIVTIVITSRNRCHDLLRALSSCLSQSYETLEVIVYDDASDDDTSAAVRSVFPQVRIIRHEVRKGLVVRRNEGFRDATGEFVLSIDDDAYFTDPGTVARVVELFQEYPNAAAIALPYTEPRSDRGSGRMAPLPTGTVLRNYIGCAHALRRQVVLDVGGYRELLVHQAEERDLSVRLLNDGWDIIYGDSPPLVHLYSPIRERERVNYYGCRNTVLFNYLNVPHPYALPRMLADSLQLVLYRFGMRTLPAKLHAVASGWGASWQYRRERAPVSKATYQKYRSLPGHGPLAAPDGAIPKPLHWVAPTQR